MVINREGPAVGLLRPIVPVSSLDNTGMGMGMMKWNES